MRQHRWSDRTNDEIADGAYVIAFSCEYCNRWVSMKNADDECVGRETNLERRVR